MTPEHNERRNPPATITDHWRLTQLQIQWERYQDNPLVRKEIEQEFRDLLEILHERGGFL